MKHQKQSWLKMTAAGLLVGTLDITAACLHYYIKTGRGPAGVLKYVASGVFGQAALTGGDTMPAWGLLFHYIMALAFSYFFFQVFPLLQSITHNRVITGVIYGSFTWLISTQVIVRLSNTPKFPFDVLKAVTAAGILITCIGIPLAYIAAADNPHQAGKATRTKFRI